MSNNFLEKIGFYLNTTEQRTEKYLSPFQLKFLQENLEHNLRPEYRRRIEIMLLADLGKSQSEICTAINCSQETARYWISMAKFGQAHQWNNVPIGRPKTVNAQYIERLQELVICSPHEFGYSFRRWTARWLSKHLAKEFRIEISDRHINRLLKQMGLSTGYKQSKKQVNPKTETDKDHSHNQCINISNLSTEDIPKYSYFSPYSKQTMNKYTASRSTGLLALCPF